MQRTGERGQWRISGWGRRKNPEARKGKESCHDSGGGIGEL